MLYRRAVVVGYPPGEFEGSAAVLLGHHQLVAASRPGFVDAAGIPTIPNAADRLDHFGCAGMSTWKEIEAENA